MTEKRFKYYAFDGFEDNGRQMSSYEVEETLNRFQELSIEDLKKIEQLEKENNELKEELRIYRQVANCHNCKYHDYDWFDDGDEFEVCRKGNDVSEGICKDWEEL